MRSGERFSKTKAGHLIMAILEDVSEMADII